MTVRDHKGFKRRTPRARMSFATLAGLVVLVAGAVTVAFLPLDELVAPRQQASEGPVIAAAPKPPPAALKAGSSKPSAPPEASRVPPDPAQAEAETLLADALRRLAKLEGEGVRIWGSTAVNGIALSNAEQSLAKANSLYDRRNYADAVPLFRQAISALEHLSASKSERFRLAMSAGEQALMAHSVEVAVTQFRIAVALAPADPAAAHYLERAQRMPEILTQMTRGREYETAGDLAGARSAYGAAAALDPEYAPARENLARVEAQIAAKTYRDALSEAHARLDKSDLRGARAALERARKVDPNGAGLRDIQRRLEAAALVAELERLRVRAAELERQEKWAEAVKVYDKVLAMEGNAAIAQSGRARAQALARLHAALDRYIAEPSRLQSAEPRAHAKTLMAQARSETGPVLSAKLQQLDQLVSAAEKRVPVLLKSDRNTEVTIQRVGRLGTFDTREIELPPGKYVAVGSRIGYRDVRVPFEISGVSSSKPIVIQATEPIR